MDVRYFAGPITGYTMPVGDYEVNDINLMMKFLHPKEVKVNITIDDNRLKSNLNTTKKNEVY